MSFPQARGRMEDAIFDRLGEDANWSGVGVVRIRRREADENLHLSYGEQIAMGRTIKVRKSQVEAPAEGVVVQVLDDDGVPLADALFEINGEPKLDANGVWTCPAKLVA
jgi:hypothetical protein